VLIQVAGPALIRAHLYVHQIFRLKRLLRAHRPQVTVVLEFL